MDQRHEIVRLVNEAIGSKALGCYLHGSAVRGGLKPASDVDVLVVIRQRMDDRERRALVDGEPYTRQLDGKLRELRFYLDRQATRITYWVAPGRRIVLLTIFRKTRMREHGEISRARRVLARCVAEQHVVDEEV
jgi:predicted nucleotidyltransferase